MKWEETLFSRTQRTNGSRLVRSTTIHAPRCASNRASPSATVHAEPSLGSATRMEGPTPSQGTVSCGVTQHTSMSASAYGLGWVTDLLVAGFLATGDYVPGVSDLDLVALTTGPVGPARQEILASLHRELDQGATQGLDLGCVYVDASRLADLGALHPTWTHGSPRARSCAGTGRAPRVGRCGG
jgi:hypothetical protein